MSPVLLEQHRLWINRNRQIHVEHHRGVDRVQQRGKTGAAPAMMLNGEYGRSPKTKLYPPMYQRGSSQIL
jgi:hypothetical protein